MKRTRYNKLIGLTVVDRIVTAVEVVSDDDRLSVRAAGSFELAGGVSADDAVATGNAIGEFLRSQKFTAKAAVVGLPAKWLVVKPRELPPADEATRSDMLRLAAETEFSSELTDLAFDYAGTASAPQVLLVATPKKYVDWAMALCDAAKLTCAAISPASIALADAMARTGGGTDHRLILTAAGSELVAMHGTQPIALRTLRASAPGELRRAIAALPGASELTIFDSPDLALPSAGIATKTGDLASLGLTSAVNEQPRGLAAAAALAASNVDGRLPAVDFAHSRLAPPKRPLVPRWAIIAAVAVILGIIGTVLAFNDLTKQEAEVAADSARVAGMKKEIDSADSFVSMVSFARNWHSDSPRYVALLRDFTGALPDDSQTFITGLQVRDVMETLKGGRQVPTGQLAGSIYGKTSDQQRVQNLLDALKAVPTFSDVKPGGTQASGRGGREVTFTATFTYKPAGLAKPAAAVSGSTTADAANEGHAHS